MLPLFLFPNLTLKCEFCFLSSRPFKLQNFGTWLGVIPCCSGHLCFFFPTTTNGKMHQQPDSYIKKPESPTSELSWAWHPNLGKLWMCSNWIMNSSLLLCRYWTLIYKFSGTTVSVILKSWALGLCHKEASLTCRSEPDSSVQTNKWSRAKVQAAEIPSYPKLQLLTDPTEWLLACGSQFFSNVSVQFSDSMS